MSSQSVRGAIVPAFQIFDAEENEDQTLDDQYLDDATDVLSFWYGSSDVPQQSVPGQLSTDPEEDWWDDSENYYYENQELYADLALNDGPPGSGAFSDTNDDESQELSRLSDHTDFQAFQTPDTRYANVSLKKDKPKPNSGTRFTDEWWLKHVEEGLANRFASLLRKSFFYKLFLRFCGFGNVLIGKSIKNAEK